MEESLQGLSLSTSVPKYVCPSGSQGPHVMRSQSCGMAGNPECQADKKPQTNELLSTHFTRGWGKETEAQEGRKLAPLIPQK